MAGGPRSLPPAGGDACSLAGRRIGAVSAARFLVIDSYPPRAALRAAAAGATRGLQARARAATKRASAANGPIPGGGTLAAGSIAHVATGRRRRTAAEPAARPR